jgi:predicted CXXCH cytochrome family protein
VNVYRIIQCTAAVCIAALTFAPAAAPAPASPRPEYKLLPGAAGQKCLECHEEFEAELKKSHLHPLVEAKECTGCHVPHASDHSTLLTTAPADLCVECHKDVIPEGSHSVHDIVAEGRCDRCHDSHGSDYPSTLIKPGNALCYECHKDIADEATQVRFKHDPVTRENGCLNCHQPHAAPDQQHLLRSSPPSLCRSCHQTSDARFQARHQNYPVAEADCSGCHSPHGSNHRGLLQDTVHPPVLEKACDSCHNAAGSAQPLGFKKEGTAVCSQCHEQWLDETMGKKRIHWPMAGEKSCGQCHSPHAARYKALLSQPTGQVCGKCHQDTVALQQLTIRNPENEGICEPVKKGECTACHSPHSADQPLLFDSRSSIERCGECHEWQAHSSHPIGAEVIDPRNGNLTMDCLSCHRGCGTVDNPVMLDFPTIYDLCVSCHEERRR